MPANGGTLPRHPATTHVLKYFAFRHLPVDLQVVASRCAELANRMVDELPDGPELTAGLRKLLEAKDCFVRAALDARPAPEPAMTEPGCQHPACVLPHPHAGPAVLGEIADALEGTERTG